MDEAERVLQRPRGMPEDTPDYMAPAWVGCLHWAAGDPEIIERFFCDQDINFRLNPLGGETYPTDLDLLQRRIYDSFITWVNENIWGSMDAEIGDKSSGGIVE